MRGALDTRVLAELDRVTASIGAIATHDEQIKAVWRNDPALWARDRLGILQWRLARWSRFPQFDQHAWDGDTDPLWQLGRTLGRGESVGCSSAVGVGKTFFGAILVLWFLDCWEGGQVITLAPKEDQLKLHIWKEIGKLWPAFKRLHPQAELLSLEIRMRPARKDWGAVGFPVAVGADEMAATKAQGFHAEHMLFVLEETPGINRAIITAVNNTCTAPHNLMVAFGNPDSAQDGLSAFCALPGVKRLRISALDHPNVVCRDPGIVPGAITREKIDRQRENLGEDNPLYMSRVRGVTPAQAQDALIRLEWCVTAAQMEATPALSNGPSALGVDVANSEGGDKAAIARGKGAHLLEVVSFPCPDANAMARQRVHPFVTSGFVLPKHVGIDSVGVGAGSVNELKRLRVWVTALNGGEKPWRHESDEEFVNLRSQMWWQMRLDLQHGRVKLPNDPELFADLTAPAWGTRAGKIYVESKDDIKGRLRRSPDKGDAVVYWNWVRQASPGPALGGYTVTT